MSMPSLIKIPEGSPGALPVALGCLCHPGPSFPVARGKPGVPAVQNEQGRKWDIQLGKSASRVLFARDLDRFEDGARLTPDRCHPPRKSLLRIANNFLGTSHFPNFLKLRKKVPMWPKPRFRLFRGRFRPEGGPAEIRECFHSIRKAIPDISMSSGVT